MIRCTQTQSGWLAKHVTISQVFALGFSEESARKKAEAKLYHYNRAEQRVKLRARK